ncbi:hypothetical protein MMC08_007517, partial [Hypocenomyce scalaris]|nr:hypothetical protein [Hypocenomyce scalaris]
MGRGALVRVRVTTPMLRSASPRTVLLFTPLHPSNLFHRSLSHRRSTLSLPPNAWDSHMHITDPTNFPISASATYAPHAAPLTQALRNASRLNLPNLVFVQPSTYGTNNACLLAALDRIGPDHGRGVVAFDPTKTNITTLRQWHARGVRGVRINLKSAKQEMAPSALTQLLRSYADAIRPLRTWALELFVDMAVAGQLEGMVPELGGVKLVLAHLGSPEELKMPLSDMRGWDALLRMMRDGGVYVKVSGP